MKSSESIVKISPALLKAQKLIGGAKKGAENPFFHSKYADLGTVMEACKDALNDNGITVLQPIGTSDAGVYVETLLLHESGEWISDCMTIAPKSETNPQEQGSAITYARRYSLQSMLFIPAEDDDANTATFTKPTQSNLVTLEKKKMANELTPAQEDAVNEATDKLFKQMYAIWHSLGRDVTVAKSETAQKYGVFSLSHLTVAQLQEEIASLKKVQEAKAFAEGKVNF